MRPATTFPFKTFPFVLLSLLVAALAAWGGPASAQDQEKRIALVVGDGAYSKAPLATAANDAGLIAQTLQAAGFDVIGARDLDGDTLRKSLRDFIQKAESSGRNTVAMIYLAGYGVQLAGENYFIPVDSNIVRDPDIPIEGLRISDYTRQLASIPLKASVVVLDAARQQPFIEGGAEQIASGLALVEAENNMLIAFNAAPGTVGPTEPGPYGLYAQSLAEMIRTGGLSLPDVFDRVRLRVNESSKGAQIPWDDQKIQAEFTFFDRAPDAPPAQGPADQVAAFRNRPIHEMSVQDAYTAALERDTLQGYEDFVASFPDDPLAKRVRAIIAARREAITWRRTYRVDTREAYWSYLRLYPRGPHAWDARRRLAILIAPLEPPPSFAMLDYDLPPPPPDEIVYVDRPVVYFGDPVFGFAPPPPPPVFFLPPPPPDFVVLPPPFPVVGLFVLPQPRFVPFPAFVRPPVYVAPPANNIIFNNIHNTTVINNVINVQPPPVAAGNAAAAVAAAAGAAPVGATTPVPGVVRTQALSIQKNPTQPLSPSQQHFIANPTARAGTPIATPANVTTTPPTALPQRNALPGAAGGAQLPEGRGAVPGATAPIAPGVTPNTRLAPTGQQPAAGADQQKGAGPGAAPGKTPVAQTQPTPGPRENLRANERKPGTTPSSPPLSPPTASKPTPKLEKPTPPVAPPRVEQKRVTPPPPPPKPAAAPPRPAAAPKLAPPPRPQAAPKLAPPPPPRQQAAPRPPPPPPPKPQAAPRPPPPPAPPRPAAVPRPAAPAPAKKCKPGERC